MVLRSGKYVSCLGSEIISEKTGGGEIGRGPETHLKRSGDEHFHRTLSPSEELERYRGPIGGGGRRVVETPRPYSSAGGAV